MNEYDLLSFLVVQAEKDAKKKARAKELKKLRKEKEKKAQVHILLIFGPFSVPQDVLVEIIFFFLVTWF